MNTFTCIVAAGAAVAAATANALASVVTFEDKAAWQRAVGSWETITFAEVPPNTPIDFQYEASHGVTMPGPEEITWFAPPVYPNDGFGLVADDLGGFDIYFDEPKSWMAADYAGFIQFELYDGDTLLWEGWFAHPSAGNFAGIISDIPFDHLVIRDPADDFVVMDDLHFGAPIPGAGVLPLLALGLFRIRRRRSTSGQARKAVSAWL